MPKFKFSKLVRDKLIDRYVASGAKPVFRRLSPTEHKQELVSKIIEEAQEIPGAKPEDVVAEIADVQQAIDDLKELYGLQDADVAVAQAAKNKKNGAFKKGLFVESLDLSPDDPWVDYYRQHADRYPEIR